MFELFDPSAKRVITASGEYARKVGSMYHTPVQILWGCCYVETIKLGEVLESNGLTKLAVENALSCNDYTTWSSYVPFSESAKSALHTATDLARSWGVKVSEHHLAIGLMLTPDTDLDDLLSNLGADRDLVRNTTMQCIAKEL
jgi:ATP-dependent Clp protease ATP-binding subunit ClpA